jgi:hypothetical protein
MKPMGLLLAGVARWLQTNLPPSAWRRKPLTSNRSPTNNSFSIDQNLCRLHEHASRFLKVLEGIQPSLQAHALNVEPRDFGIVLALFYVQAIKTFRALHKLTSPEEPLGLHGFVLSRMLFENCVTAYWIAALPKERSELFLEFEFIAEVQKGIICRRIDDSFFDPAKEIQKEIAEQFQRRQFFDTLPKFTEKSVRTRSDLFRLRWTDKQLSGMVADPDLERAQPQLRKIYDTMVTFANSAIHGTPFSAFSHLSDDLEFQFGPDSEFARYSLSWGMDCVHCLSVLEDRYLHTEVSSALAAIIQDLNQGHLTRTGHE